jgi:hypothetical protein
MLVAPLYAACWSLPLNVRLSRSFKLLRAMHKSATGKHVHFSLLRR